MVVGTGDEVCAGNDGSEALLLLEMIAPVSWLLNRLVGCLAECVCLSRKWLVTGGCLSRLGSV